MELLILLFQWQLTVAVVFKIGRSNLKSD